jgi:hypothetical protein
VFILGAELQPRRTTCRRKSVYLPYAVYFSSLKIPFSTVIPSKCIQHLKAKAVPLHATKALGRRGV